MHLTLSLDWGNPLPLRVDGGRLEFENRSRFDGLAGIYLMETLRGPRVTNWYIGQGGGLANRLSDYMPGTTAPPTPAKKKPRTHVRVGREIATALAHGDRGRYYTATSVSLCIPERYVDEHDEPLMLGAPLKAMAFRHMAEAAAVVYRLEMSHGSWERCLNDLKKLKATTRSAPSPYDDMVFEFRPRGRSTCSLTAALSAVRRRAGLGG